MKTKCWSHFFFEK